jgi:acyl-CoA synthetase (AMP-forming)/AMP-acid ligase II
LAPIATAAETLGEILAARAQRTPEQLAFSYSADGVADTDSVSYSALQARAQHAAGLLLSVVRPGARVLLLFEAGLEFAGALFGCFQAGVVGVSATPPSPKRLHRTMPRLAAVAQDAQADAVLTTAAIRDAAEPLLAEQHGDLAIPWIAVDEDTAAAPGVTSPAPGDLAFIQYTSGSTFTPRGVMLTHANFLANIEVLRRGMGLSEQSRAFCWLPQSHDMGLITGILAPVYLGYPCALMPPLLMIKRPLRWLEGISRFRATVSGAPNFAYDLAVRRTDPQQRAPLDLSCWEVAFNGAEPIHAQTLRAFAEALAPCGFRRASLYPCYGLAEATLMVTGPLRRRDPTMLDVDARALGAGTIRPCADGSPAVTLAGCGEPGEGHELSIVDPATRRECPPDQIGEIWVSGPSVAAGYWRDEAATSGVFGARIAGAQDSAEFLRTGDLGFLRHGELFIVGRSKDVIVISGRNHHPHDIELSAESAHLALRSHCSAAFEISLDDERTGAAIVLEINPTAPDELPAIIQAVRRTVAHELELQLERVALVAPSAVPKTTSGKIQRRLCGQQLAEGKLDLIADWHMRRAPGDLGDQGRQDAHPASR